MNIYEQTLFVRELQAKVQKNEEITRDDLATMAEIFRKSQNPSHYSVYVQAKSRRDEQTRVEPEQKPEPKVTFEDYKKAREEFRRFNTAENYARMKELQRLYEQQTGEKIAPPKVDENHVGRKKRLYEMNPSRENWEALQEAERGFKAYQTWLKRVGE